MEGSPINVVPLVTLSELGVTSSDITSGLLSMAGRYICIRSSLSSSPTPSIIIIDTVRKAKIVIGVSGRVDNAAVSPHGNIAAIRVDGEVQIHDLVKRSLIRSSTISGWHKEAPNDRVQLLQWIDATTVAIVTDYFVYSMDATNEDAPERLCTRLPSSNEQGHSSTIVTSIAMSHNQQWLAISANQLVQYDIVGLLQIHSMSNNQSQPLISSQISTFGRALLPDRRTPSVLLCFVAATPDGPSRQLNILELGAPREAVFASATALPLEDGDVPISIMADNVACILYIFTKRGLVTAHDLPSGKLLFAHKVRGTTSTILATGVAVDSPVLTSHPSSGAGVIAVDGNGGVFQVLLDSRYVVNYCKTVLHDLTLASSFVNRLSSLPECKGLPAYPVVPLTPVTTSAAVGASSVSVVAADADPDTLRKTLSEKEHVISELKSEIASLRVENKVAAEDLILAKKALKDAIARVPEAAKGPNAMGFYLHDDD